MQVPDGHATAERRSVAFHLAVADRLDEQVRRRARRKLEEWAAGGQIDDAYAQRWRRVLDLPLEELAAAITADDEATRDLRQCTPFAGVLTPRERWAIIRVRADRHRGRDRGSAGAEPPRKCPSRPRGGPTRGAAWAGGPRLS